MVSYLALIITMAGSFSRPTLLGNGAYEFMMLL
jgi:hypothetical protein